MLEGKADDFRSEAPGSDVEQVAAAVFLVGVHAKAEQECGRFEQPQMGAAVEVFLIAGDGGTMGVKHFEQLMRSRVIVLARGRSGSRRMAVPPSAKLHRPPPAIGPLAPRVCLINDLPSGTGQLLALIHQPKEVGQGIISAFGFNAGEYTGKLVSEVVSLAGIDLL